jgi:hypothetical protein
MWTTPKNKVKNKRILYRPLSMVATSNHNPREKHYRTIRLIMVNIGGYVDNFTDLELKTTEKCSDIEAEARRFLTLRCEY